jgi:aldehyde dehydrogenase (NAD+)
MTGTTTGTTTGTIAFDAAELVARLRTTFQSGRTRSVEWRKQQLGALQAMLDAREADFLDALAADLGKAPAEGYATEVGFVKSDVRYALAHLDKWLKPERVHAPIATQPSRAWIQRDPLGVALVIAPWNYPVQLSLAPLVGAIAAGNCAVLKPSELAPASSAALARTIGDCLDPDATTVVEGAVEETQALLAQRWDTIFYTGNGRVGRVVMAAAAEHLTPVTLELGGKSPVVVDRTANLRVAGRRIAWGKYLNAGQTCIAPDYVLADAAIADELTREINDAVRGFYGHDPRLSPDYGRIVNERHFGRLVGYLDDGAVVFGGAHDALTRYLAPTALRDVPDDAPVMTDEIFGPVLPIRTVTSTDDAIAFVNDRDKPLALYVFTGDDDIAERILAETSSGGAAVNATLFQVSVPELPFGGVGGSGMGAYHGRASFDAFSHAKSVLRRATRPDPPLAYPPYTTWKERLLRKVL